MSMLSIYSTADVVEQKVWNSNAAPPPLLAPPCSGAEALAQAPIALALRLRVAASAEQGTRLERRKGDEVC